MQAKHSRISFLKNKAYFAFENVSHTIQQLFKFLSSQKNNQVKKKTKGGLERIESIMTKRK
jgi:hypothetical protein